ncbi:MAG: Rieske 2Fe-2S domain-containing protein [Gammaproteobacteria bacterium]|nr:Rieske 2Fe-2S domain-containing protein [Gammaproteobacteria bacterium]
MLIGTDDRLKRNDSTIIFDIDRSKFLSGFVIQRGGDLYAYVNHCPHNGSRLDWVPGDLFDETGKYLICATHGAIFEPETGKCVGGPCINQTLIQMNVKRDQQNIYVEVLPSLLL